MFFRVYPRCYQTGRNFARTRSQLRRVLKNCNRLVIYNALNAFVVLLLRYPIANCSVIITKVQITGRLDAGKYTFHSCDPFALDTRAVGYWLYRVMAVA